MIFEITSRDLVLLLIVLTLVAVLVAQRVYRKRALRHRSLAELSQALGTMEWDQVASSIYQGIPYRYLFTFRSMFWPSCLRVWIPCPSSGSFSVSKERKRHRLFKQIGLCQEIETGDCLFDQEFYIQTEANDFASAALRAPEKRQAIREIHRLGFTWIRHDGKVLEAVWHRFRLKGPLDPALITSTVSHLGTLGKEIPAPDAALGTSITRTQKARRTAAFAIPQTLLLVGTLSAAAGFLWFTPLEKLEVILSSLKYSLPLFLICMVLCVVLIKGRSAAHRELLFLFVLTVPASVISASGLFILLNGLLDSSAATSHTVTITHKYTTKEWPNAVTYKIFFQSWRKQGTIGTQSVSASEYQEIAPYCTTMTVVSKAGWFDYDWLVAQRINRDRLEEPRESVDLLYAKAKDILDNWEGDRSLLCEARRYLLQILKTTPNHALAYVGLARAVSKQGFIKTNKYVPESLKSAHVYLSKALRIDPRLFDAYISSSYTYAFQKDFVKARKMAEEAERINSSPPHVHLLFAYLAKRENHADEAIRRANLVIQTATERRQLRVAYQTLGAMYERKKEYELAEGTHLMILQLAPHSAWAKINYSSFLIRRGNYDKAIEMAESALAEMDFGMGHHVLASASYKKGARLYWKKKKYLDAGEYFKLATTHDPRHANAFYGLGLHYRKAAVFTEDLGLLVKCETALRRALEIDPNHKQARNVLERLPEIKRAIAINPTNAQMYFERGAAYVSGGDHGAALQNLLKAIELDPTHFQAYKALDDILVYRREWGKIIAYWTEFLALQPNHARAYYERGGAFFHKGDLQSALKDLHKACSLGLEEACRVYERYKTETS